MPKRNKNQPDNRRNEYIRFSVSQAEKQAIELYAKGARYTVSALCRESLRRSMGIDEIEEG